jgi:hypothetical protein
LKRFKKKKRSRKKNLLKSKNKCCRMVLVWETFKKGGQEIN